MDTLDIDIETYSSVQINKSGMWPYVLSPDFKILLVSYSYNFKPVKIFALAEGERMSESFISALTDPTILKRSHNAPFEMACFTVHFGVNMIPEQWSCTSVLSANVGLPLGLDKIGRILELETVKDSRGKGLVKYFTQPCRPTRVNGGRLRNEWYHDQVKWNDFKGYNITDVVVECSIEQKLAFFEPTTTEQKLWAIDYQINSRGVHVDWLLVEQAIKCFEQFEDRLVTEIRQLTGIDSANKVQQIKEWIRDETGEEEEKTLNKKALPGLIDKYDSDIVKRVLEIRQVLSKSSVKKYYALKKARCPDGKVRGLFQFYGAGRTGRWAGRGVQVQNLRKNSLADLDLARRLVRSGSFDTLELMFGDVPDVLSQLIRTVFIPSPGNTLVISDLKAIEARVIAWYGREQWKLDIFNSHGLIYEATAARMLNKAIEEVTKEERNKVGKITELSLGFQGGVNAMIKMGALDMGIPEEELQGLVDLWRSVNPNICKLWKVVNDIAIDVVKNHTIRRGPRGLQFYMSNGVFFIKLPSNRVLSYQNPKLEIVLSYKCIKEYEKYKHGQIINRAKYLAIPERERINWSEFSTENVTFWGLSQTTKIWCRQYLYGGKIIENIVQGTARDVLAEKMILITEDGYDIVLHVHDEAVMDIPDINDGLCDVETEVVWIDKIMSESIAWAEGLPIGADTFFHPYYKKE